MSIQGSHRNRLSLLLLLSLLSPGCAVEQDDYTFYEDLEEYARELEEEGLEEVPDDGTQTAMTLRASSLGDSRTCRELAGLDHPGPDTDRPPNRGWRGGIKKLGGEIIQDCPMYYTPDDPSPDNQVRGWSDDPMQPTQPGDSTLRAGRLVLIQAYPGEVNGYYWVDPDLWGLNCGLPCPEGTPCNPQVCGNDLLAKLTDRFGAHDFMTYFNSSLARPIGRRGFVQKDCIRLHGHAPPDYSKTHSQADDDLCPDENCSAKPKGTDKYYVKPGCIVTQRYNKQPKPDDHRPLSHRTVPYSSYGALQTPHFCSGVPTKTLVESADPVHVLLNTPSARVLARSGKKLQYKGTRDTVSDKIGGGGFTLGYLKPGDAFYVADACHDDNLFRGSYSNQCTDQPSPKETAPARWAYGKFRFNQKAQWGWIWTDCLVPADTCHVVCCDGTDSNEIKASEAECDARINGCVSHGGIKSAIFDGRILPSGCI